jgi:hypothetical protein
LSSLTIAAIFDKAERPGHETSLFLLLNSRLINQCPRFSSKPHSSGYQMDPFVAQSISCWQTLGQAASGDEFSL